MKKIIIIGCLSLVVSFLSGCATNGFSRIKIFTPTPIQKEKVYLEKARVFEGYRKISKAKDPTSIEFLKPTAKEEYEGLGELFNETLREELEKAGFTVVEKFEEADLLVKPQLYYRPMTFTTVGDVMIKIKVENNKGKELLCWGASNPLGMFHSSPEEAIKKRRIVKLFVEDLKAGE